MTASKQRFSGLMGSPEPTEAGDVTAATSASAQAPTQAPATPAPALAAAEEPAAKKSKAKVQLNTQQPEELKNAVDKAAAYLSFTTGKKVTTTDVVERALRVYLDQLPEAARGV